MPVNFEKKLANHYIHCRMVGEGTLKEVLEYVNQLSLDPDLDVPFYEIVDFTEVDTLGFGYYESDLLQNKYKELGQQKGYQGTIFVTGSAYGEAISKMFKTTGDFKGVNIRVVPTLEEAELLVNHLM